MSDSKEALSQRLKDSSCQPAGRTFPIAKPSSDNFSAFIKFAKKEFGKDAAIQQCGIHFTGNLLAYFIFIILFAVDCVVIVSSHRVEEESLPFQIRP